LAERAGLPAFFLAHGLLVMLAALLLGRMCRRPPASVDSS